MTTELPVGTFFQHRYKNAPEYCQLARHTDGELVFRVLGTSLDVIPDGATVHTCVWTGPGREHLESRGSFVKAND